MTLGGTQQIFLREGSALRSIPLPFQYIPYFCEQQQQHALLAGPYKYI